MNDFITPSRVLTKLTAAELAFVYHGVHHGHSYVSQSCIVDLVKKCFHESSIGQNISCSKTKARKLSVNVLGLVKSILEVTNQPCETAYDIVASLRDVLKMNGIDIQYITSIGADNTNTNIRP
ncbi:unnamed protein product [Rotaria magnacalcarata]|uniref:Uncharacterized protein n=1 Tax=Rotaria magnacalcarata TaxID=392030 RepID=A0A816RU93_9BILA|nr:unnamed protein product [Rotaria magnacalcarata]CAF3925616.1 unnamed protein product [Rotaria magnacalcarata]